MIEVVTEEMGAASEEIRGEASEAVKGGDSGAISEGVTEEREEQEGINNRYKTDWETE